MIKDCFGIEARVGDHIAFSRGNAGAKPFEMAVITKMTEKSVFFSGKTGSMYRSASDELRRGEGCFVIDTTKRDPGKEGRANAWESFDKHVRNIVGPAAELRREISEELHKDGCASAWVHHAYFVDALVEKYEESLND
ncbi:hypothetical protein CR3_gp082 [Cronobacter phage CR3]|uniref:Uncharacterized protein n=3 Tax=Certrevirus TaxID=1914850 RepID=I1TRC4_9CAUD|nr:hypothetical protein CR3_gp082 [Cronobacter phage CR3]YP_009042322.1 hypothetical protein HL10_gp085 [Cronobacter phage CR8]YP_009189060.1 hypothetical protein ADU18_0201 [Cronobacter phage PBES 02]AFH21247.1 hypothetical protein CR3_082 [Cronobacter phage CR3]AIA64615.1 hypothetical protein CR8_085 [Cronobacter phage CR8]AKY04099.1 hypothetical protein ADU18_0201 [Cronobacter phage PBES 02]